MVVYTTSIKKGIRIEVMINDSKDSKDGYNVIM